MVAIPRLEKDLRIAYGLLVLIEAAALLLPLPVPVQMLPLTVVIIYIASQNTIRKRSATAETVEHMKTKDAYMFPIIGSITLFSLYVVFKLLPKEWITVVVKAYFFLFGTLVLATQLAYLVERIAPADKVAPYIAKKFKFTVPKLLRFMFKPEVQKDAQGTELPPDWTVQFTALDAGAVALATLLTIWYVAQNHWLANNLLGIAFSLQGIELISLGSFFNGFVLLCGLFIYDIFWVFGTDVMVTVAKSFDAPIKLLFPRSGVNDAGEPLGPSMLGLGDIVIPGIFIALLLRFDWSFLVCNKTDCSNGHVPDAQNKDPVRAPRHHLIPCATCVSASTPYFSVSLVCYFLGLLTTVLIMFAFNHAQPALLYLVPACLGAAFGTALYRGQLGQLWSFKETEEELQASQEAAAASTPTPAVGVNTDGRPKSS